MCKAAQRLPGSDEGTVGLGPVFDAAEHRPRLYRKAVCSARVTVAPRIWVKRAVLDLR